MNIPPSSFLRSIVLCAVVWCNGSNTGAQQPSSPSSIYELLNLQENGCPLPDAPTASAEPALGEMTVPMPPMTSGTEDPGEALRQLFANALPLFPEQAKTAPLNQVLPVKGGGNCFREKDRWGYRNAAREVVIRPLFERVLSDTAYPGFVGYRNDRCNYYLPDGDKLFQSDYFFIQPTPTGDFIVQTEKGFGIARPNGRYALEPGYSDIRFFSERDQFYYLISPLKNSSFLLSADGKKAIGFNTGGDKPLVVDDTYLYWGGQLVDVQQNRRTICELQYYVEIIDENLRLASLLDRQNERTYLIHFDGRLVTPTPFQRITRLNAQKLAVASVEVPAPERFSGRKTASGLINAKGEWLIPPIYSYLFFANDSILIGKDEEDQHVLLTAKNELMLGSSYPKIIQVTERLVLLVSQQNQEVRSELFDLAERKVMKSDLPYSVIKPIRHCDGKGYIALQAKGETYLGSDFEPLFERPYSRVFYGPEGYMIGTDFNQGGVRKLSQVYSCDGQLLTLTIEGQTHSEFVEYNPMTDERVHVLLKENLGYFVGSDGATLRNDHPWRSIQPARTHGLFITMESNGQYGLVDEKGQTILPPEFGFIGPFDLSTGLAPFTYQQGYRGYLTSSGEPLFGVDYEKVLALGMDLFRVEKDGQWGVLDSNGRSILPVSFESVDRKGGLLLTLSRQGSQRFTLSGKAVED